MPLDEHYHELNRRCRAAIEEAENLARELGDGGTDPDAASLIGAERVAELRRSLADVLAGLADPDPNVRLVAIGLFGTRLPPEHAAARPHERQPEYDFPAEAAEPMLALAESDPDDRVRMYALGSVSGFYRGKPRNHDAERRVARIALASDDVTIRHLAFHGLTRMSDVPFHPSLSPKYLGLPVVFDEFYVQQFLTPELMESVPIPPPAAQRRSWLRRLFWVPSGRP